jgi:hypothetical protein
MKYLIFLPFILQAVVIFFDEWLFHLKRGLPRWERIGHPLDTLSFIACLVFALYVPYDVSWIKYYVGLGIFSCLLVTKDEFVHKHHCPASEQWLHAILFINHSILIAALGLLWANLFFPAEVARPFMWVQLGGAGAFFLYQVIYWNFIYRGEVIR